MFCTLSRGNCRFVGNDQGISYGIYVIVQLLRDVKNYFKEVTNWIEMTLFISSIATMVPWTEYTRNTGVLMVWQWQLGSVAIFLSWMELLFFVESIPKFGLGIYVLMFANIVKTFLKFLIVLSVFVFAFAFTFHALFQNQVAFMYLWNSIVKTIVIMIGEIEYDSMFNSEHTSSEYSVQVHYNEISYFVFVVALMTMSIIVMNMLVGLAVDDIKQVQNKAELKSISQHAKLVLETEYLLPRWLNNWKKKLSKKTLKQSDKDKREIKKYHSRKKDDGKRIEEKVQNVKADVQALRMRLHDINKRTQSIESMVKINMEYNEFDYDGDDDDLDV
ncbi:transient receptor potential cation channel subfamily A member 1 homolog isoform X1 [Styela clava]